MAAWWDWLTETLPQDSGGNGGGMGGTNRLSILGATLKDIGGAVGGRDSNALEQLMAIQNKLAEQEFQRTMAQKKLALEEKSFRNETAPQRLGAMQYADAEAETISKVKDPKRRAEKIKSFLPKLQANYGEYLDGMTPQDYFNQRLSVFDSVQADKTLRAEEFKRNVTTPTMGALGAVNSLGSMNPRGVLPYLMDNAMNILPFLNKSANRIDMARESALAAFNQFINKVNSGGDYKPAVNPFRG